jgi:phage baseplate assembly protein gpV
MDIEREIEQILACEEFPDPRLGSFGELIFHEEQIRKEALPCFGIVSDNTDPLGLGRVRVSCDLIAPGCVTPWIPIVRSFASINSGFWFLPDIGTQVILGFIQNNLSEPFVFGCIYNLKHLPPKHSIEDFTKSFLMQTKNHRLEIIDEDGKETIIIYTMMGQVRIDVSAEKGLQIINEIGGINIKCRKIKIEGGKEISFQTEKVFSLQSNGTISAQSKKKTVFQNDKDVKMKAQCIKLQASQGVTTEGKQIAAEGNQVMGFDIHNMIVPSGDGTKTVPLPHPYIGKLVDKLSSDVKINNHNAATKGSKSKHDDAMHMQLPGTIKFKKNPNKEGEVTGGTGKKVKINGNEAAVIGSTLTTCNDTGAKDNSAIIAPGASIPMPLIINPKNIESFRQEREEQKNKQPEFTSLKWNKSNAKEGEELELSVQVKDIDDGNMISFQIWREGQEPNSHVPHMKLMAAIEGGMAKAKWMYHLSANAETIPDQNPKFFFTAHSAWCQWKKSENVNIELKRPALSNPHWQDKDGKKIVKALVGEVIKISVDCNEDMEEECGIIFEIFDDNKNKIDECSGVNKNGKAETEWLYHYEHDTENHLTEKPKFTFKAQSRRCKEIESNTIEMGMTYHIIGKTHDGKNIANTECTIHFSFKKIIKKTSNVHGEVIIEDEIPGSVLKVEYTNQHNETEIIDVQEFA